MEFISQKLEVMDWPLKHVGESEFFGYVVAMGIFPREWGAVDGLTPYVDFAYSDSYCRYRLPDDDGLRRKLLEMLCCNLVPVDGDIYGKVVITCVGDNRHSVELP